MMSKLKNFIDIIKHDSTQGENINAYESDSVVDYYDNEDFYLSPSEESFIKLFENQLSDMRMLDIGIGGGRTTSFFAELVKEYHGIDYAKGMVELAKKKFGNSPNAKFSFGDVRELKDFSDNFFDLVFFSFNGLDSIIHKDRLKGLKEIKRVLKTDGMFFFSSHNLIGAKKLFALDGITAPKKLYRKLILFIKNKQINEKLNQDYALITDGAHSFKVQNYYIKPHSQIKQLKKHGFNVVGVYDIKGDVVSNEALDSCNDLWLHYLCKSVS